MTAPIRAQTFAAATAPLNVVVIGGGIGGLCLAQGLKKAGIKVAVYERDRTPSDRLQGYRVHISPNGSRALHECLPPHLFAAFDRTCGKATRAMRFLTEDFGVLLSLSTEFASPDPVAKHRSVSRISLRQVLLAELDDVVHFDKTFTHYEELPDGRVVAHFADGAWAVGDVLVAADGGGSRVRRQFLPHAPRLDTGVIGIAGKVFLDTAPRAYLAPELLDGMCLVAAKGAGLFVAVQELGENVPATGIGGNDDGARGSHLDNTRSYLMWAVGARRAALGLAEDAAAPDSATLRKMALDVMAQWDDRFRALVHLSDPGTVSLLPIRTSAPVAAWPTGRVTLIGDAIHSMTPYRGIGANIALKDAMHLCRGLTAVQRGEQDLSAAIGGYEANMRDYGFKAVAESLAAMHQMVDSTALRRTLSRTFFRAVDRLPGVKRRIFARMGEE
jgi:2-polyprenyl-6-methoxyphenol hydroxylase-like FAD-dependent oxidoreductase